MRSLSDAAGLVGTALSFVSMGLLVPVLPLYVDRDLHAGLATVGAVVAVPSVAAILARPLVGRLTDVHGPRPVAFAGALILAVAALGLLGAHTLALLLPFRMAAGAGEALVYVGFATAGLHSATDRPARIAGFSIAVYVGLLVGAPIGAAVNASAGHDVVWLLAACAAAGGAACAPAIRAGGRPDRSERRGPLVQRDAIRPGLAYGASVWGYTAFNTFVPVYVLRTGGHDARTEYVVYAIVLITVRIAATRLPARLTVHRLAVCSLLLTSAGLGVLVAWPAAGGLITGTAVLAAGQALGLPAFVAIALDTVAETERGSALATVTAFFDVGFLTCSLGMGALSEAVGLRLGFLVAAVVSVLPVVLLRTGHRHLRTPSVPAATPSKGTIR